MKLIVGLGNGNVAEREPDTRHDIGFMVIRQLARRWNIRWMLDHLRDEFVYGKRAVGQTTVGLLGPTTLMNRSGDALDVAVREWQVALQELLIVCDDVNLPVGAVRLRPQGGDGGHHGLASCLEVLQTPHVPRLRVGVGVEPLPRDLTEFVLSPFGADERPMVMAAIDKAVEACEAWATAGIQVAMNRVNTGVGSGEQG
ncbi:MAG: aminoacyl-tRNA hydrolase [Candidatus Omnitrophica bacterium]|nr:aminoacyl-tRNA hydrolase [Candidatus Omnitrophota bacterium]